MPRWTEFDLNAFEARRLKPFEAHAEGCDDESELHEQIRQECLRRGWLALHGSMAHKTFRTEGEFDFVIICEFPTVLFIEAKTRTGKLSEAQQGIHAWTSRLKHQPHTVRSMDEFLRIANQVTKSPHDTTTDAGIPQLRHVRD